MTDHNHHPQATATLDERAHDVAERLRAVSSIPVGLDETDGFDAASDALASMGAAAVAHLRTKETGEILVHRDSNSRGVVIARWRNRRRTSTTRISEGYLSLRSSSFAASLELSCEPDLDEAINALAQTIETAFSHDAGSADSSAADAAADSAAATLTEAVADAFARMIDHALDPDLRRQPTQDVAAGRAVMGVVQAMAEEVRPRHFIHAVADLAARTMSILVARPDRTPGEDPSFLIPVALSPELRATLPGRPIVSVQAALESGQNGDGTAFVQNLSIDFTPGIGMAEQELPDDPLEIARMVRAYGSDGSDLAAAIDGALA